MFEFSHLFKQQFFYTINLEKMRSFYIYLIVVSLSLHHHRTAAVPHHRHPLLHAPTSDPAPHTRLQPTTFFEVTTPINHPPTKPCSHLILRHDFAFTYGKPPVQAPYVAPSHCLSPGGTAVLEWSATCQGRQFDRIFGVWLGGVELLRSCTAEPRPNGIFWKVEKDITKYYSLLMSNQTLVVYLGNLVNKKYTGVYHVEITIRFYPPVKSGVGLGNSGSGYSNFADLIVPISRNLPLNDGLWFEVKNSSDVESKEFEIPKNVYRGVLEVYVSFHEKDEFWYSNLPNEYIAANNLSNTPGNGPFREVLVSLDGDLVGVIWPFTVIYTGGINPLLWRPITGIGSFDLPTYDVEITPFLGSLLDGKKHRLGFSVTNALNVWYIDANLQLWLDKTSQQTTGQLSENKVMPLMLSSRSDFKGLDGNFSTSARRSVSSVGWVRSSYGNITSTTTQNLGYVNFMVVGNNGNMQAMNQTISFNTSVSAKIPSSSSIYTSESYKRFPLSLYTNEVARTNDSYVLVANISLEYDEDNTLDSKSEFSSSTLRNLQKGQGNMFVKNHLVVSGLGSTNQTYKFKSNQEPCYFRNVSASNYTILYDEASTECIDNSSSESYDLGWEPHSILLEGRCYS